MYLKKEKMFFDEDGSIGDVRNILLAQPRPARQRAGYFPIIRNIYKVTLYSLYELRRE